MSAAPWRVLEVDEGAVSELMATLALPEPVSRILVARGYAKVDQAERFLRKSMSDLVTPFELSGMKVAAARVARTIQNGEAIVVHGDFDADGITSAALLGLFFRDVGARATPFVPNRLMEGHGISMRALELAQETGAKLLITCDCGSSSGKEIMEFQKAGVETIVTDHHLVPENFPSSTILVNPKASTSQAQEDLSGVGVAFMLAVAVRSELRDLGFFSAKAEPNLRVYLDIVALGTIADLAPLRGQNRILVAKGLEQLAVSKRPGILAMRETAGLSAREDIGAEDVGFRLAPRINAAARLGHASEALELLMTADRTRANELASKLEVWNTERKELQLQMLSVAEIEAAQQVREGRAAIVLSSSNFHSGVIGLVAQKLSEKFQVPTFVFALEGALAKGSARSRWGVNLVEAMEECKDLLLGFGGHKEAGGCTMDAKQLPEFRRRFVDAVASRKVAATREICIDAVADFRHLNGSFLSSFNRLRPFGMGNPEPIYMARASVVGQPKEMGKDHVRVTLRGSEGPAFSAVGFGLWREIGGVLRGTVEVAYTPEENEWNGRRDLRIRLRNARTPV